MSAFAAAHVKSIFSEPNMSFSQRVILAFNAVTSVPTSDYISITQSARTSTHLRLEVLLKLEKAPDDASRFVAFVEWLALWIEEECGGARKYGQKLSPVETEASRLLPFVGLFLRAQGTTANALGAAETVKLLQHIHKQYSHEFLGYTKEKRVKSMNDAYLISVMTKIAHIVLAPQFQAWVPGSRFAFTIDDSVAEQFSLFHPDVLWSLPIKDPLWFSNSSIARLDLVSGTVLQSALESIPRGLPQDRLYFALKRFSPFAPALGRELSKHTLISDAILSQYGEELATTTCIRKAVVEKALPIFHNMPPTESTQFVVLLDDLVRLATRSWKTPYPVVLVRACPPWMWERRELVEHVFDLEKGPLATNVAQPRRQMQAFRQLYRTVCHKIDRALFCDIPFVKHLLKVTLLVLEDTRVFDAEMLSQSRALDTQIEMPERLLAVPYVVFEVARRAEAQLDETSQRDANRNVLAYRFNNDKKISKTELQKAIFPWIVRSKMGKLRAVIVLLVCFFKGMRPGGAYSKAAAVTFGEMADEQSAKRTRIE